jgi:hypothetical protein
LRKSVPLLDSKLRNHHKPLRKSPSSKRSLPKNP